MAREEWQKTIDSENLRYMVKVIGQVQKESIRFFRYFESMNTLSLILGTPDVYEEVINQLTGLNRHLMICAGVTNKVKRYKMIAEHLCEYKPDHIEAFNIFLDIYDIASLMRDRGEVCKDTNALQRYGELVNGDPNAKSNVSRMGLKGLWELEQIHAAGETLVMLGLITPEEFSKKIKERENQISTPHAQLFGCPVCGGIYNVTKGKRALWDERKNPEMICETCRQSLAEGGRLRWVEGAEGVPAANGAAAAPVPQGPQQSKGHLAFTQDGQWEFFLHPSGDIYKVSIDAPLDVNGIRQGARFEAKDGEHHRASIERRYGVTLPKEPRFITPAPMPQAPVYQPQATTVVQTPVGLSCAMCGQTLAANSRFCSYCGTPTKPSAPRCSQCGTELPASSRFCLSCGTPVRDERAAYVKREIANQPYEQVIKPQVIEPLVPEKKPETPIDKATLMKEDIEKRIREKKAELESKGLSDEEQKKGS